MHSQTVVCHGLKKHQRSFVATADVAVYVYRPHLPGLASGLAWRHARMLSRAPSPGFRSRAGARCGRGAPRDPLFVSVAARNGKVTYMRPPLFRSASAASARASLGRASRAGVRTAVVRIDVGGALA